MSETLTIDAVKERHEKLYDRALQEAPRLRRTLAASTAKGRGGLAGPSPSAGNGTQAFLREINDLLENLAKLSSLVSSFEDYRWLSHAAVKWQNVFAILDVPTFVKLDPPSDRLLPPVEPMSDAALSEQELDYWIKTHAELFAYTRIARLKRFSTPEEIEDDSRMAFVYLASDILDGKISLVKRIAPRSYWHLERVWMEDLKHLRAYLLWLGRGGGFGLFQMTKNYFDVCDHLRYMLTDAGIKAPAAAFEPFRRFLEDQYLMHGKVDAERNDCVRFLIGDKAYRLYVKTGRTDSEHNWQDAETYVKTFYENITAAVLDGDYECTLAVLRALQCDRDAGRSPYHIINAFEATLATYFLRPDLIRKVWENCMEAPAGHTPIISEVSAPTWPASYDIPENCRWHFEIGDGVIRFRGVMSDSHRQSLSRALNDAQQQVVNELYRRSRTVCRETTL